MCFSATASFSAAAILGGLGGATVAKIRKPAELPLAAMPLLFGAQQAMEGMLWWTATAARQDSIVLASVFAGMALVLWPVLTPLAIGLMEKAPRRRRLILALLLPGLVVATYGLWSIASHPYLAWPVGHSLIYVNNDPYPPAMMAVYVLCVLGPPLLSSHGLLKLFGGVVGLGLAASLSFFFVSLVSVWCFFAALASLVLLFFSRRPFSFSAGAAGE